MLSQSYLDCLAERAAELRQVAEGCKAAGIPLPTGAEVGQFFNRQGLEKFKLWC